MGEVGGLGASGEAGDNLEEDDEGSELDYSVSKVETNRLSKDRSEQSRQS